MEAWVIGVVQSIEQLMAKLSQAVIIFLYIVHALFLLGVQNTAVDSGAYSEFP